MHGSGNTPVEKWHHHPSQRGHRLRSEILQPSRWLPEWLEWIAIPPVARQHRNASRLCLGAYDTGHAQEPKRVLPQYPCGSDFVSLLLDTNKITVHAMESTVRIDCQCWPSPACNTGLGLRSQRSFLWKFQTFGEIARRAGQDKIIFQVDFHVFHDKHQ
jgi:hypothetical protein